MYPEVNAKFWKFFVLIHICFKVTANLFGLEFFKILKSSHRIAHYICFLFKKKLFENVFSVVELLQILCFS